MKARTKQRLEELYEMYKKAEPETDSSFEEFVWFIKNEHIIYSFVKTIPDNLWEEYKLSVNEDHCKQKKLQFDWDCLPQWTNKWIAMDEDGEWYCYETKPVAENSGTFVIESNPLETQVYACRIPKKFEPVGYTGTWEDSLTKNPIYII